MKANNYTFHLSIFALVFSLIFASLPKTPVTAAADSFGVDAVFSNASPITINTAAPLTAPTVATAYPSTINVSGMSGTTTRVEVSLRGLTHARSSDMDFLLVGPAGRNLFSCLTRRAAIFSPPATAFIVSPTTRRRSRSAARFRRAFINR